MLTPKLYRDAFLAVDQREEVYAAELEPEDNLGTPPPLFTDSWASPIYPRWFMDAVKIWERYKDTDLNFAHQSKFSSEFLGDRSSSIDKEQISQDSEGLQEDAGNAVRAQGVDNGTITSNAEEATTPGKNVSNEVHEAATACIHYYDLTEENEAGPTMNDYDSSEEYFSENNEDGSSGVYYDLDQGDAVGPSIYDYDWSEEDLGEEDEAEASEQQHILDEEDEAKLLIQSDDQKDEQASPFSRSSCQACMLPDDEWMLMCENEAIHKDSESWYHFICVGLSIETIPRGQFSPVFQSSPSLLCSNLWREMG